MSVNIGCKKQQHLLTLNTCSYITLSIKTKLTPKLETGIHFLKILMSLKKVLEMFLIFSVMEHVEIKFN